MEYMKLSRNELKERFRAGRMPTEEDFMSLVDSMVNSVDEGFVVSEENGLEIKQKKDSSRLMSFFSNLVERKPQWFASIRKNSEKGESSFNLKSTNMNSEESAVTIVNRLPGDCSCESPRTLVGVGKAVPKCELDVNGLIASKGRIGFEDDKYEVAADGEWHDVTDVLTGCQCFEIVAGVGGSEGDGKFALAHAIAVNVFNSRPKVEITQSYSGGRGARIEIRWRKNQGKFDFTLQLRVRHKYQNADKVRVRYKLTKLWYDTQMIESILK